MTSSKSCDQLSSNQRSSGVFQAVTNLFSFTKLVFCILHLLLFCVSSTEHPCFIHRSSETSSQVSTSVVGTPQDELGIPVSLLGQLASVAFFDEALLPEKVAQLYHMGGHLLNILNFALLYLFDPLATFHTVLSRQVQTNCRCFSRTKQASVSSSPS